MITLHDLDTAIAKCQGDSNPDSRTCMMLAAFLTIKRELFGESEPLQNVQQLPAYSYASEPPEPYQRYSGAESVGDYGDSDFLQAVKGQDPAAMWAIMDELMDTLKMVNERVYNGVMRRIR